MRAIWKVVHFHQTHNLSLPYFGIFQPSKQKAPLVTPKKEFCRHLPFAEARSSQHDDSKMAFLTKALHMVRSMHVFFFNTNCGPKSPLIECCLFVIYCWVLHSFALQFCAHPSIENSPYNKFLELQVMGWFKILVLSNWN
jgi:hypothetical protein